MMRFETAATIITLFYALGCILHVSGTPLFINATSGTQLSTSQRQTSCKTIDVAIAYDNGFCALYQNSEIAASHRARNLVHLTSSVLQRDTCHTVRLVHIEPHCNDPNDPFRFDVDQSDPDRDYVSQFGNFWRSHRSHIQSDTAILLTGSDGTGQLGEVERIGGLCSSEPYSWVEMGIFPTFVHEVGHLMGATHKNEGVMRQGRKTSSDVYFDEGAKQEIARFMATATCL